MGIGGEIEPGRPSFDPGQCDLLDGIEADCAEPDRLGHGTGHDVLRDRLHQPQHLDELALAALAHARFHQVTQMLERFGQVPILQGRCLIECIRLGLEQRQVMQRIEFEGAGTVTALMASDLLAATQDAT